MSSFIWGKIKHCKKQSELKNFTFEDSSIYFSSQKNELFISDLYENENYFMIALGQDKLIDLTENGGYISIYENYFYENYFYEGLKRVRDEKEYFAKIRNAIEKFVKIIRALCNMPNVVQITLYCSGQGSEEMDSDYCQVEWNIDNFGYELFESMKKTGMLLPTIKATLFKQ